MFVPPREPNNGGGNKIQDCGQVYHGELVLDDDMCSEMKRGLCEIKTSDCL